MNEVWLCGDSMAMRLGKEECEIHDPVIKNFEFMAKYTLQLGCILIIESSYPMDGELVLCAKQFNAIQAQQWWVI